MSERFTEQQVEELKRHTKDTLIEHLGITYEELSLDKVVMSMPVGPKTHQPYGVLHGGASVVLAETAASIATAININPETHVCFGMEINANHIRSKKGWHCYRNCNSVPQRSYNHGLAY